MATEPPMATAIPTAPATGQAMPLAAAIQMDRDMASVIAMASVFRTDRAGVHLMVALSCSDERKRKKPAPISQGAGLLGGV